MLRSLAFALLLATGCRSVRDQAMTNGIGQGGATAGGALKLEVLPIVDVAQVDGLKLLQTAEGTQLLYSKQVCRSPALGLYDCAMEIRAVAVSDPSHAVLVASLPRLLPPRPGWDARVSAAGAYEFLYEEAGGAVNRLLHRDPAGRVTSPSAAHPFGSFTGPRFVRGGPAAAGEMSAVLNSRTMVLFPASKGGPPSKSVALGSAVDGVVGGGYWTVLKTRLAGETSFDVTPGRLSWLRFNTPAAAAAASPQPFPGFLAFELDALDVGGEVVVFATGKPAALLTGSAPARPIHLAAEDRSWLSALSRPTLSLAANRIQLAAIANPGTPEARVLYGDFPVAALVPP